jgi:FkbM family methyltransferase
MHEPLADLLSQKRRKARREKNRISRLGRYAAGESTLYGERVQFPDGASYISMIEEIQEKEIYKFSSETTAPRIIDCGANIGLSAIYFKYLFPHAKITAFEPDPRIFKYLQKNISQFNFQDIELCEQAVWEKDGTLKFSQEGADAGNIAEFPSSNELITVACSRLYDRLDEVIDFLKIDIEGAELLVLEDCKSRLHNVMRLFVEYHSYSGRPQELDQLLHILKDTGFRYYIQAVGSSSPTPFIHVSEHLGMDLQLNIFAYRNV